MFKMDILGQGTWHFGENRKLYKAEIESIRYGIQNGDHPPDWKQDRAG